MTNNWNLPAGTGAPSTREQVMDALMALLKSNLGTMFKTYTRRFMTWEQMVASNQQGRNIPQPALILYDGVGFGGGVDNFDPRGRSGPGVLVMRRTIVVYAQLPGVMSENNRSYGVHANDYDLTGGGAIFHPMLDAIQAALGTEDSEGSLTLGGLVSHCWIKGDALIMTGELDPVAGQGMMTIPVEIMLWPSS